MHGQLKVKFHAIHSMHAMLSADGLVLQQNFHMLCASNH